ncbi:transposase [Bradyrhizobium elkanii]|uniref:transposase n=1 Tax=Bradyrhizobium elkanii TaxID=29448 RepID=UPI0034E45A9E
MHQSIQKQKVRRNSRLHIRRPLSPRIEVYAGAGRKRWPDDLKAQIAAESLEPGAIVTDVARRHGCRPQQVHDWRGGRVWASWCCRLRRIPYRSCLWCRNRRYRRLRSPPCRGKQPLLRSSSRVHG